MSVSSRRGRIAVASIVLVAAVVAGVAAVAVRLSAWRAERAADELARRLLAGDWGEPGPRGLPDGAPLDPAPLGDHPAAWQRLADALAGSDRAVCIPERRLAAGVDPERGLLAMLQQRPVGETDREVIWRPVTILTLSFSPDEGSPIVGVRLGDTSDQVLLVRPDGRTVRLLEEEVEPSRSGGR